MPTMGRIIRSIKRLLATWLTKSSQTEDLRLQDQRLSRLGGSGDLQTMASTGTGIGIGSSSQISQECCRIPRLIRSATSSSLLTDSSSTQHVCEPSLHKTVSTEDSYHSPLTKSKRTAHLSTPVKPVSTPKLLFDESPDRSFITPIRGSINNTSGSRGNTVDSLSSASSVSRFNRTFGHRSVSPATFNSYSTFSSHSPPPQPPPTCPLPSIPGSHSHHSSSRSIYSFTSTDSSPLVRSHSSHSLLSPNQSHHWLNSPQLFHRLHPSTFYHQALNPEDDLYDDDPFAAEKIVVPGRLNRAGLAFGASSDEESVDPLGPISHSSRPNSFYAGSESCYSVNTTVERLPQPSLFESSRYPHPITSPQSGGSWSEESQDGPITPSHSGEDDEIYEERRAIDPGRAPVAPFTSPSEKRISFGSPVAMETFSFGLPNRFDGFFFGSHRRPESKSATGSPAMVLEVSPPLSSTSLSTGQVLKVKLRLASLFDHLVVSFVGESRSMAGQQKLKSHRFLKHEVDLHRPSRYGCWLVERGLDAKDWIISFRIPRWANCDCAKVCAHPEGLELPSSLINHEVFISYHLIVRAIGKHKKPARLTKSKKKTSKAEERLRLTVMIKNGESEAGQRWLPDHRNQACFSISS